METIGVIIQARMGSSRLPGKTLKDILGKPMLFRLIERIKKSSKINKIIIATTVNPEDDVIEEFAKNEEILYYRGSSDDVLDRYYQAAKEFNIDILIRITGDCPIIDPFLVDDSIKFFFENGCEYTGVDNTFPNGLDHEIFYFSVLEKAWKEAKLKSEREHVTPYIWKNPGIFRIKPIKHKPDLGYHRWTVDEEEDFQLITKIFEHLYPKNPSFTWTDVLNLVENNPNLSKINAMYARNEGYKKSLKEDGIYEGKK